MKAHERIVILDFGGQYAHLIASRIRREQVLSEIMNADEADIEYLKHPFVKGIIFSGGPQSVYEEGSVRLDNTIFKLGKPILGICYGHQYLNHNLGGKVTPGNDQSREYGRAEVVHNGQCPLFEGIPERSIFWMSHGDTVSELPEGFKVAASTDSCAYASVFDRTRNFYSIQFHAEVTHSEYGKKILQNFIKICGAKGDWTLDQFIKEKSEELSQKIGDKQVILFVSGGVDSTVCFAFLSRILGKDRVKGLFIDTGLLRQDEVEFVSKSLRAIGADLTVLSESDRFLGALKGITDPEKKRSIIGNTFLEVQKDYFAEHKLEDNAVLAQGTIYPDTIESGGTKNAATIKTHHNRVPEIEAMIRSGRVIEPIADLYKDEVRFLGEKLGLPHPLVWRHPFPGPGLGVRILCSDESISASFPPLDKEGGQGGDYSILPIKSVGVQGDFRTYRHPAVLELPFENFDLDALEALSTRLINQDSKINRVLLPLHDFPREIITIQKSDLSPDRIARLQKADHIVTKALENQDLMSAVWQFPVVLVPMAFNGKGKESIILRPIDSIDAMSASVGKLPWSFFAFVTQEILKDPDISAVLLDITSKPPGTIEWE